MKKMSNQKNNILWNPILGFMKHIQVFKIYGIWPSPPIMEIPKFFLNFKFLETE